MSIPVKIEINESGFGSVQLDGHDVSHSVRSLSVEVEPGPNGAQVVLRIQPRTLDISLPDADIAIDPSVAAVLVATGWTPPADDGRLA